MISMINHSGRRLNHFNGPQQKNSEEIKIYHAKLHYAQLHHAVTNEKSQLFEISLRKLEKW